VFLSIRVYVVTLVVFTCMPPPLGHLNTNMLYIGVLNFDYLLVCSLYYYDLNWCSYNAPSFFSFLDKVCNLYVPCLLSVPEITSPFSVSRSMQPMPILMYTA